jgi:hypothetical protein
MPRRSYLTTGEEGQRDQCSVFGFEALDKWRYGEEVEDHMDKVPMQDRKQVEPVHYRYMVLALFSY